MKKIAIFIALAASTCDSMIAQDTVWQKKAPLSNYYCTNWIDTSVGYSYGFAMNAAHIAAKQFITKDTIRVYGIAAMMSNAEYFAFRKRHNSSYSDFQNYLNEHFPEDPTLENCQESLVLFQYHGGTSPVMQQLGDSLQVHQLYTPVTHWMMTNTTPICYIDTIPAPIYERFFSTPQTVCDTFYTGYTQTHFELTEYIDDWDSLPRIRWNVIRPEFELFCFSSAYGDIDFVENEAYLTQSRIDSPSVWYFKSGNHYFTSYIFPILTPEPQSDTTISPVDTTVTPVDTTVTPIDTTTAGVSQVDMVGRYVSVSPNPAGDRATVLSSFGLTRIEAYDPQGRQLYAAPATGLRTTLDVSTWPRGTALLHIHTPAGTTVKKLLLR